MDEDWKLCDGLTCIVTIRSSTITSLVRKSAPIVALYWLVNFLLTYWFISDVLPTLESPSMITFRSTFFLVAMVAVPRESSSSREFTDHTTSATCDRHTKSTSVSFKEGTVKNVCGKGKKNHEKLTIEQVVVTRTAVENG